MTKIKNVQAHSIVRIPDGRIGVAPNRGSKGKYTVLIGVGYGAALNGDDEVQVLQLGVDVAFQRAMQMAADELQRTLQEQGLSIHNLLPTYGQVVAKLQRGDGSTYEAYYVIEVNRCRMRAVLDYAHWCDVRMTAPDIVAFILQDQAALAQRTWPDNTAWHTVTLCKA